MIWHIYIYIHTSYMYIRFPPLRISFLESACSLTGQGDEEALWASRSTTGQVSRSASGVSVVTPWVFDILRWLVEGVFDVFLMWWYFMIDAFGYCIWFSLFVWILVDTWRGSCGVTFGFLATLTHSSKVVITCCHTTILTYHFFPTRKGNVFSQCIPTYVFLRICFDSFSFLLLIMKKNGWFFCPHHFCGKMTAVTCCGGPRLRWSAHGLNTGARWWPRNVFSKPWTGTWFQAPQLGASWHGCYHGVGWSMILNKGDDKKW